MNEWLNFYKKFLLKHPLAPDDHLFPVLSAGKVHPQQPISSASIMKLINKMTTAAGVQGGGHFATHCFRRGGAQYRFMLGPPEDRWPLS
jgi:hypothetical protein